MENYYYTKTEVLGYKIYLLASEKGLMYLSSDEHDDTQFFETINHMFAIKETQCVHNDQALLPYVDQLTCFSKGKPPLQHTLMYDLRGTVFQKQVWQALLSIPFGSTTHYGAIAEQIGNAKAVRAVGRAIGANPILILIPCHRVVGKDGALTGFRSGIALKQLLLEHEQQSNGVINNN